MLRVVRCGNRTSLLPHSAWLLQVRRLEAQIVALVVGLAQLDLAASPFVDVGSSTISPGFGFHGLSTVKFFLFSSAWVMPLYRKRWLPWPTWFVVPSHVSHPMVHLGVQGVQGVQGMARCRV